MRSGRIMEEEADEPSPGPLDYLFYCFSHSRYGFQLEEWLNTYLSFFNPRSGPRLVRHLPFLLADARTCHRPRQDPAGLSPAVSRRRRQSPSPPSVPVIPEIPSSLHRPDTWDEPDTLPR